MAVKTLTLAVVILVAAALASTASASLLAAGGAPGGDVAGAAPAQPVAGLPRAMPADYARLAQSRPPAAEPFGWEYAGLGAALALVTALGAGLAVRAVRARPRRPLAHG